MGIKQELEIEEMIKKIKNLKDLGLGDEDIKNLLGISEEDFEEIEKNMK